MYKLNYKGYEFNITQNEDGSFNIPENIKDIETLGTALKPANEPICVARKPLSEKSVAENVLKWGTGGINIDGCRIEFKDDKDFKSAIFGTQPKITSKGAGTTGGSFQGYNQGINATNIEPSKLGRFPANIIFDDEAGEVLDEQSGISKPSKGRTGIKGGGTIHDGGWKKDVEGHWPADNGGGASRFFYVAKVSKKERNLGLDSFEEKDKFDNKSQMWQNIEGKELKPSKNNHPTLKPINLMTYLCRLVTPPNGIVLDPFMGSGSTGISALLEGFNFVGMEMDEEYFKIAEARINSFEEYRKLLK
jgi:site-specific DNA-methyltransferase (adenine-specific)